MKNGGVSLSVSDICSGGYGEIILANMAINTIMPRMVAGIIGNRRKAFQSCVTFVPKLFLSITRPVQLLISDPRVNVRVRNVHQQVHHKNYDSYQQY